MNVIFSDTNLFYTNDLLCVRPQLSLLKSSKVLSGYEVIYIVFFILAVLILVKCVRDKQKMASFAHTHSLAVIYNVPKLEPTICSQAPQTTVS